MIESPRTFREPTIVIEPRRALLDLRDLWQYRELLYFLVWREVKVRYKQTAIGAAWAVFQPLLTMVIFTVVFGQFAKLPSDGLPYPLFAYAALLPWNYFSQGVVRTTGSVVGDANLIRKVYFPRLVLPLSATIAPLLDFAIAFGVLLGLMWWFGVVPTVYSLLLPAFLGLAVATALAVGLWLSALNVRYRDVGHAIPFLVQSWLFVSPVAYPVSLVPERWRVLYSLNPIAGTIEGFRWALLGKTHPDPSVLATSALAVAALLVGGVAFFTHMERSFADVA